MLHAPFGEPASAVPSQLQLGLHPPHHDRVELSAALHTFVTRQPDTQNFSGRVEAGLETTDGGGMGWTTRGSVNIPLVTDVAGLRVSAFKRVDPAYLDNIDPNHTTARNRSDGRRIKKGVICSNSSSRARVARKCLAVAPGR